MTREAVGERENGEKIRTGRVLDSKRERVRSSTFRRFLGGRTLLHALRSPKAAPRCEPVPLS